MAAAGRRVRSTAQTLGMSETGLRRWLDNRALPNPGALLREVRLQVPETLCACGVRTPVAGRVCGVSAKHAVQALRLHREKRAGAVEEPGIS
jgi:hypothetical protein